MSRSAFYIGVYLLQSTEPLCLFEPRRLYEPCFYSDKYGSTAIEGLYHVAPKWSNRSSKVDHLGFSLGQWCAIVAYQIPYLSG